MSTLAPELNQSTALTPVPLTAAELEANKLRQHKAEDVIYTLNHAVTCLGVTDTFVMPAVGGILSALAGRKIEVGCGADHHHHHHEHAHVHEHENPFLLNFWKKSYWAKSWSRLKATASHVREDFWTRSFWANLWQHSKGWVIGEAVGDLGAVPVTIAFQRLLPNFMHGLRRLMEPAVGGLFHRRATATAQHWAMQHDVDPNSQAIVDRAEKLYNYEMDHLPQMVMWTVNSIGLNYGTMKLVEKFGGGEKITIPLFLKGKALGAAVTAGTVFGLRALSPSKAHAWDETVGKHLVVPVTKRIGGVFGVNAKDVDDYHAQHGEHDGEPAPTSSISGAKQHAGAVANTAQQAVV